MPTIRAYDITLASKLDEKSAQFIHQLHYWLTRPKMGYTLEGMRYIKNSYAGWTEPENFPHWSVKTVQRVVNKLKEEGIILIKQLKGKWDRTLFYCLNYSHKLLVASGYSDKVTRSKSPNSPDRSGQNDQMFIHTNTTPKKTTNTYRKVSKQPEHRKEKKYRKQYKEARRWLEKQDKVFRREVNRYVELHCNKPSTQYPKALGMKIAVEIWKKFNGKDHHTDFEYIDKEKYAAIVCSVPEPEIVRSNNFDDEMMRLYESGGMYGEGNARACP